MHTLVIESDRALMQSIRDTLGTHDTPLRTVASGEDGVELARSGAYTTILIGPTPLELSGLEILRTLRNVRCATPVILLAHVSSAVERARALNAGADDCISLPFDEEELKARLRAIARRAKGYADSVLTFGELSINLNTREVRANGCLIHLKPREYAVLEALALAHGRVVESERLFRLIYEGKPKPEAEIIRTFISQLRKKLAGAIVGGRRYLVTSPRLGYALRAPEQKRLVAA